MKITKKSILTGIERTRNIPVNPDDYLFWKGGYVAIQDAMPYLTWNDREFILSGITLEEWNDAFSEERIEA